MSTLNLTTKQPQKVMSLYRVIRWFPNFVMHFVLKVLRIAKIKLMKKLGGSRREKNRKNIVLRAKSNDVKEVYADHILIPQDSTGSTFLMSHESPYFSHYHPKISPSNSL